MATERMLTASVKLEPALKSRLQSLAEARRRKAHWLMHEAILEYVEREEKREQFRRDALESWREFQETGLHVTGDEALAWLETWGADEEKEPPLCHE